MPRQPTEPDDAVILALDAFCRKHGRYWKSHPCQLRVSAADQHLLRHLRSNHLPWFQRLTRARLAGLAEQARYRKLAGQAYAPYDDMEIDAKAEVSASDDGAWVQAWVWIPNPDLED